MTGRRPAALALFLVVAGSGFVAIAVWMAVAPAGFVDSIAGFGEVGHHFVRDLATFAAPLGVALVMAASRPAWQVPVIGFALLQNGLHLVNHVVDVRATEPAWHGPVNVAGLALLQVGLLVALVAARRVRRPPAPVDGEDATP